MDCRHAPLKLEQSLVPERFSSFSSFGEDHQARTSSRKMNRSRRIDNSGFLILVDVLNLDILSDLEFFFSFLEKFLSKSFFKIFSLPKILTQLYLVVKYSFGQTVSAVETSKSE